MPFLKAPLLTPRSGGGLRSTPSFSRRGAALRALPAGHRRGAERRRPRASAHGEGRLERRYEPGGRKRERGERVAGLLPPQCPKRVRAGAGADLGRRVARLWARQRTTSIGSTRSPSHGPSFRGRSLALCGPGHRRGAHPPVHLVRRGQRALLVLAPAFDQSKQEPGQPTSSATRPSPTLSPEASAPTRPMPGRGGWSWYTGSAGWNVPGRSRDHPGALAARLETCPEGRENVRRHMLAESTYMGHTHIRYI